MLRRKRMFYSDDRGEVEAKKCPCRSLSIWADLHIQSAEVKGPARRQ